MAKSKLQNAMILDENRFKLAKQMPVVQGGPMNNNPMNVTSIQTDSGSLSGFSQYPYGDMGVAGLAGVGTNAVFPVERSKLPGNTPMGRRLNNKAPYGLQQQPSTQMADALEGSRLANDASNRGLFTNMAMGPVGSQAIVPGQFPGNMPNTSGPFMQQFMPTASVDPMTPGANKTVIKKKSSKNKGKA